MSTTQIVLALIGMAAFCFFLWLTYPPQLSARGRWWFGTVLFCTGFWSVVLAGIVAVA